MKLSVKTKLIAAGIVIVLGGTGVLIWQNNSDSVPEQNQTSIVVTETKHEKSSALTTIDPSSQKTPDVSPAEAEELIAFLDDLDKANDSAATGSAIASDVDSIEDDAEGEKSDTPERTPEQWRKYELLARLLPRYHELSELLVELDIEQNKKEFSTPPPGLSNNEFAQWERQREVEIERKRDIFLEKEGILAELMENFPEAIKYATGIPADVLKAAKIAPGVKIPTGGRGISFDYRKLREIVGGPLPTDRSQR